MNILGIYPIIAHINWWTKIHYQTQFSAQVWAQKQNKKLDHKFPIKSACQAEEKGKDGKIKTQKGKNNRVC